MESLSFLSAPTPYCLLQNTFFLFLPKAGGREFSKLPAFSIVSPAAPEYPHTAGPEPTPPGLGVWWNLASWLRHEGSLLGTSSCLLHSPVLNLFFNPFSSPQAEDTKMQEIMRLAHEFLQNFCAGNQQNQALLHKHINLFLNPGVRLEACLEMCVRRMTEKWVTGAACFSACLWIGLIIGQHSFQGATFGSTLRRA